MNKRKTAYIFTLIAGIVILAHAVVPHHHHHELICFESSHCAGDAVPHNHNDAGQNHQHDNNSNSGTCFLSDYIPAWGSNASRFCSCSGQGDSHAHDFQAVLIILNYALEAPAVRIATFAPLPYPHYSFHVYSSAELRGPPAV